MCCSARLDGSGGDAAFLGSDYKPTTQGARCTPAPRFIKVFLYGGGDCQLVVGPDLQAHVVPSRSFGHALPK